MKDYKTENIINFSLVGHASSGKTTFAESLALCSGTINKAGTIESGSTLSDYRKQEISHGHSIGMSLLNLDFLDKKINIVDTPGYLDFLGEMKAGLGITEVACLMVNSSEGIEVGTELAWEYSTNNNQSKFFVINMCDHSQSNYNKVIDTLQNRFGRQIFPITSPINEGDENFNQVSDILRKEILEFSSNGDYTSNACDDDLKNTLNNQYQELIELVAESDESLLETFFENGELSEEELKEGLKNAITHNNLIPVFCCNSKGNIGSKRILEFISKYITTADDHPGYNAKDSSGSKVIVKSSDSELSAYVFKTLNEEHVGELSFFKVVSGELSPNMDVMNTSRNKGERFKQLYFLNGKNRKETTRIIAGDIGTVLKLKDTHAGDSLSSSKRSVIFNSISYPTPNINFAIEPQSRGDEDKMAAGLSTMHEEDHTFIYKFDPELKQTIVSGQGELHIDLILQRIKDRFGVSLIKSTPKVAYRETITSDSSAKYRHKKQSGGSGQFAEVWLKITPGERGSGIDFKESLVGQNVDRGFVPSVDKAIKSACQDGIIAGCTVVDVAIDFYDGKMHPVDSNDMAFQLAGKNAFKEAFKNAAPKLLEPIYKIQVKIPEDVMGDIMGDISQRRGKVSGMDSDGHFQIINAEIPLANIFDYATALKSMSSGRGMFSQEFSHYEDMPHSEAQKVKQEYESLMAAGALHD